MTDTCLYCIPDIDIVYQALIQRIVTAFLLKQLKLWLWLVFNSTVIIFEENDAILCNGEVLVKGGKNYLTAVNTLWMKT